MANEISDVLSKNIAQVYSSKKPIQRSLASIETNHQDEMKQSQTTTEKYNLGFVSCNYQNLPYFITKEGYTAILRRTLSGFEAAMEDHRVPGLQHCFILPVVFAPGVCLLDLDEKPRLWQKHHLHVTWDEKQNQQVLFIGSNGLKGGINECKTWFCRQPVFECCKCGILSDMCSAHYRGTKPSMSTYVSLWNIGEFM